jgi:cation diffusion facilitator CzcD-associated flavoprotein CzcO
VDVALATKIRVLYSGVYEAERRSTILNAGDTPHSVDVVVVGAGFAGMCMLHRLRQSGLSSVVYEAASDVGGTWWWNRYPGARCDVESLDYSYSFDEQLQQEWEWSERYATQPEILAYAQHVADRFDLRRDIRFETRVTAAIWNAEQRRWEVSTDRDDYTSARFLVMAVGCLSTIKQPEVEGIDRFSGPTYHTGRWPHEGVDLTGKRVGVIGTGSSGIQCIPLIAEQAAHLFVFQRTPAYTMPAGNEPLDPAFVAERKANYAEYRRQARETRSGAVYQPSQTPALSVSADEREATYWKAWESGRLYSFGAAYSDLLVDEQANETAAEFVRARIRQIVKDPDVAELLSPRTYPFGTKRPCLDTDYYATFNRDNVTLVDVRSSPIVELTETGIRTQDEHYELDAIVFATGYDAMTGALLAIDLIGADGVKLRDKWAAGPRTYLGLGINGFPNLFVIAGPGSPSVLTNMVLGIEQHVEWIGDCVDHLDELGFATIEPSIEAEDAWVARLNEIASATLFPRANSWWMGANVPGKPRVFMPFVGGFNVYRKICFDVASNGYEGFTLAR